jgi:hypothetical protein
MARILISISIFTLTINYALSQNNIQNIDFQSDVGVFEKFEFAFDLSDVTYNNPYDPEQIDVFAVFVAPSSGEQHHRKGFYYQDFTVNESLLDTPPVDGNDYWVPDNHSQEWRIRFSPNQTGQWTFYVALRYLVPGTGSMQGKFLFSGSFNCEATDKAGFVSVYDNKRYLKFSNGSTFFPLGENMAGFFGGRGGLKPGADYVGSSGCGNHDDYLSPQEICGNAEYCYSPYVFSQFERVMKDIAPLGGNYVRLWFLPKSFEFEWEQLGNYDSRQNRMYDVDRIVELGHTLGIYFHIVLANEPMFDAGQSECNGITGCWEDTPYSTIHDQHTSSGLLTPKAFFSSATAKKFFKRKLRYFIARWGYSPNVFSLEFINEVDFISGYNDNGWEFYLDNRAEIEDWHIEMAKYVKEHAPHMLKTVSTGLVANADEIHERLSRRERDFHFEFTKGHFYSCAYNAQHQRDFQAKRQLHRHPKPFHLQETDVCSANGEYVQTNEPTSVKWHNWLWSTSFSGAMGAGVNLSFDSDFHHPCFGSGRKFRHFYPLSRFIKLMDKGLSASGLNSFSPVGNSYAAVQSAFPGQPIDSPNCDNCGTNCTLGEAPPYSEGCDDKDMSCRAGFADTGLQYSSFSKKYDYKADFLASGIKTSNNDLIEVYALKNPSEIFGWVHNKSNYWYNLPRTSSSNDPSICSHNPGVSVENNEHTVTPIHDATIEISGVKCSGVYEIDWWYTYYGLDVDGNGNPDDGGFIPAFSQEAAVSNGKVVFSIPPLIALEEAQGSSEAPDYGFRIQLKSEANVVPTWNHAQETWNNWEQIKGDVKVTKDNSVVYIGADKHIHRLRWYDDDWNHDVITSGNNQKAHENSNLAFSEAANQIFYRGANDDQVHVLYGFSSGVVQHAKLTWNSWQRCFGDIEVTSGNEVVYEGEDGVMMKLSYNGSWGWSRLTTIQDPLVGGDIATSANNQVYYRGTDGYIYQITGLINNTPNVYRLTDENGGGFVMGTNGKLEVSSSNKIHYSYDQEIKVLDWNGLYWEDYTATLYVDYADNICGAFSLSKDDELFYIGCDGHVHLVYDVLLTSRKHEVLTVSSSHKGTEHIIVSDIGQVFYEGVNTHVHTLYLTCEQSGLKDDDENVVMDRSDNLSTGKDQRNIDVFPNPADNEINIIIHPENGKVTSDYSFQVINTLGQAIVTDRVTVGSFSIDVSDLNSGVYYIVLVNSEGTFVDTEKVLINKH